ncbi:MAG: hypothetical protein U5O39_08470 [Gammaproteobacteria bacterium]|nr:hypothetical protein [Gammaproteobacteria bacterium]
MRTSRFLRTIASKSRICRGDELDLGSSDLGIYINGIAVGTDPSQAIGFVMSGADDVVRTDGQITVAVTDLGANANALIDIAGTLESRPSVPPPLPNEPMGPTNTVSLAANNGRVRIRSTAVLRAGAHEEGLVHITANGFDDNDAGTIWFGGTADASSATAAGGTVKLLADRVALIDEARIDVSGETGGGEALIGGNYQGKGPEQNALYTYVGEDATINADAVESGDGGRVIVWADDTTRFYGEITAAGGAGTGDGGFVEVSGKGVLQYRGNVDTRAVNGETGTLLLDPQNIIIDDSGTDTVADNDQFTENSSGTSTISSVDLEAALDGSNITLQAHDDITVNDPVDTTANTSTGNLTLEAGDDVSMGAAAGISLLTGSTLTIIAGSGGATPVAPDGTADVTLSSAVSADDISITAAGSVSVVDVTANVSNISITVDSDNTGTDTLTVAGTMSATSGATTFTGGTDSNDVLTGSAGADAFAITSTDTGTLNGDSFSQFAGLDGGSGADTFTFNNAGNLSASIVGGAGDDTITGDTGGNTFSVTGTNTGTLAGKPPDGRALKIWWAVAATMRSRLFRAARCRARSTGARRRRRIR